MPEQKPSKSARKREYLALQALGERLIELKEQQLAGLSLDEPLAEAVREARGMRSHGALRRQKQLIGKLMRNIDAAPIRAALESLDRHDNASRDVFHAAEKWRDRIATEGQPALDEFLAVIGGENRELSAQLKACQSATNDRALRTARRRLFGEIHKELALKMHQPSR
jgi:ribosome-associated protein